ncbi:MAG TPA: deoxyribose-phosphate aldolase [Clostridia bacterium]|nr:deoxyribose-phosphate aldolase [Clostridia bacterium]
MTKTGQKTEVNLANIIDHTLLKQDATSGQIKKLCLEAIKYNFKSVCIAPCWVRTAAGFLVDSQVLVCTVIGFPHGNSTIQTKVFAAQEAVKDGAQEIDMVINIGALKEKQYTYCLEEIREVKNAIGTNILKVILETTLLTDEEKVQAALLSVKAGADFVKTSTGFAGGGATVEDVMLLRKTVGPNVGVKASGGIRDRKTAQAMVRAGANRLGCSAGVAIVTEKTQAP